MKYTELDMSENIHVYLDISIDDIKRGRVVVELFKNHVPKTVDNFRALCTGEKGSGGLKLPLHYKDSIFHKAVPECIVQGGDITNNDGTGGESIYGPYFEDENFSISHSEEGLLSMANCGIPHTNNSQFCVTLGETLHFDGTHVVFGRIVKGYHIINDISYQPVDTNFRPVPVCKIYDCGELLSGQDWGYCEFDYSDVYPPYPTDWEPPTYSIPLQISDIIKVTTDIKDAGNQMFKNGNIKYALQKYKKSLRYVEWYLSTYEDNNCFVDFCSTVRLNAALACIKLGLFRDAIKYCNEVVDMESNAKALFRRGLAKGGLNEHQEALVDLRAAQHLAPSDPAISAEIQRINHFLVVYHQEERKKCAAMFMTSAVPVHAVGPGTYSSANSTP